MKEGMLHIYCGEGKGKTTAAFGLAIRAAGNGIPVRIYQFLKGGETGEVSFLAGEKRISCCRLSKKYGFLWNMSEEERRELTKEQNAMLQQAMQDADDACREREERKRAKFCQAQAPQKSAKTAEAAPVRLLVILDELAAAAGSKTVDREQVLDWLHRLPEGLEVVITGRDPQPEWLSLADYITQMRSVRHPYQGGLSARRGIEF